MDYRHQLHTASRCAAGKEQQRDCTHFEEWNLDNADAYDKAVAKNYDLVCRWKGEGGECYYGV